MKQAILMAALVAALGGGLASVALVRGANSDSATFVTAVPTSTAPAAVTATTPAVPTKALPAAVSATMSTVSAPTSTMPAKAAPIPPVKGVPSSTSTVTPPTPLPPVAIPPIPEVDKNPFEPGPAPVRPIKPDVLEEGKRLFNREGRLDKDAEGHAVFIFDSGDKPMRLLENSWREYLESRTEQGERRSRWRVSGMVMVYQGTNYLLLTKAVHVLAEEENL
jgi:hypothetical protein